MATKAGRIKEPVIALPLQEDPSTFRYGRIYLSLSILTFLGGLALGYLIWGGGITRQPGSNSWMASPAEASVAEVPAFVRYQIPTNGYYSIGPANASITIVEFGDYQCQYCRQWHRDVYQALFAAYPGKLRLVYRNLPQTSIHPDAVAAAEAALCAGEQNAYWPYHDKLFSSETLSRPIYLQYAQDLNLNLPAFTTCLDTHKFQAAIQADSTFVEKLGAHFTPTFFINGLLVVGAQPLDYFKQIIDRELAGEIPQ